MSKTDFTRGSRTRFALRTVATAASLVSFAANLALADCGSYNAGSPGSETPTSFSVFNDTDVDVTVLWSNFEGLLEPYITIGPGQPWTADSYTYHNWLIEGVGYDGAYCFGPFYAFDEDGCSVSIVESGGGSLGYQLAGSCGESY